MDRHIVPAIIFEVPVAAEHQEGQAFVGVVAAAHDIADRGDLSGNIVVADPFEVHQIIMHRAVSGIVDQIVDRSEENTSELQSLMRYTSAVFCSKKINYLTVYITKAL